MLFQLIRYGSLGLGTSGLFYLSSLGLLTQSWFQAHVVYLHAIQMTWGKDLDVPEMFGFLHNQVTPFHIQSTSGQPLYAWHVLPIGVYQRHEQDLLTEPSGFVQDIFSRLSFKLLRDDPEALLVIHLHGAGGTVGSGYRCPNYRALSAGNSENIHVLAFDYRGFGKSPGTPEEAGLIADASSVLEWSLNVAKIPPSRILIYGQSLGTAVSIAVAERYAQKEPPVVFAGHILTASFVDVPTLVSTYSLAGLIPLLGPVSKFPVLFDYLCSFIRDRWSTKDRLASYVQINERNKKDYRITMLHGEDDYDIPSAHSAQLFWHAVNASSAKNITYEAFDKLKAKSRVNLKYGGTLAEYRTSYGIIREEILKYGLHDVIMGDAVTSLAVTRLFDSRKNTP